MNKSMHQSVLLALSLLALVGLQGCRHRDAEERHAQARHSVHEKLTEVIFGKEVSYIWDHKITINPCRNAEKETLGDRAPDNSHHVIKCGATKVELVNEELFVNEKSYGKLGEKAPVMVTNGKVFINQQEIQPVAQLAQK